MSGELQRWYSKFEGITDEHGITLRAQDAFEFQSRFSGRYGNYCQDSDKSSGRSWAGLDWGLRVHRSPSTHPGAPAGGGLSVSVLIVRAQDEQRLKMPPIEFRLTLHHCWDESRDLRSGVYRLVGGGSRAPLDAAEIPIPADWSHFLQHPSEYCDGEGNLLITCLMYRGDVKGAKDSLEAYLSAAANQEANTSQIKQAKQLREEEDKKLVCRAKAEGNVLFQAGKYLEAVVKYSEALNTFYGRQIAALWLNRSAAYMKAEMYQEALEDALKARGVKPDWAKVYFRIGVACLRTGNFKMASNSVEMGLRLKPGDVEMLCLRMKIQIESRNK